MRNSKCSLWINPLGFSSQVLNFLVFWKQLPSLQTKCKYSTRNFFPELFPTLCPQHHLGCVFYKQGQSSAVQPSTQETDTDTLIVSNLENYMLHFVLLSLRSEIVLQSFTDFHDLGNFEYYGSVILQNFPQFGFVWYFLRIRFSLTH